MIFKFIRVLMLCIAGLSATALADVLRIKDSAPAVYVVKKGDTLWDISRLYLPKPWLWPELWRTNTQIVNPHLIYPGDILHLVKGQDGNPSLQLANQGSKVQIKLSPTGNRTIKPALPIAVLPWAAIEPYVQHQRIEDPDFYQQLPYVLGNDQGAVRYVQDNVFLGQGLNESVKQVRVIRKQKQLKDLQGNKLGLQVRYVADAEVVPSSLTEQSLLKVLHSNIEIKRGDRLVVSQPVTDKPLVLTAATTQTGHIIDDVEQHTLLGKFNVVVLDLGSEHLAAGMVMGIYAKGPNIVDGQPPKYEGEANWTHSLFAMGEKIQQPHLKVGEVLVFSTFDKASYALITQSTKVIKRGMIVAKP
jgi:hypothetical protein